MARGRKKRAVACAPPIGGGYEVDWAVNELIQLGALPGRAVCLWLHLRALAWKCGECDPTDAMLSELMGGINREGIRLARHKLQALGLLYEYERDGARWLVPLPVPPRRSANFAPGIWRTLCMERIRLAREISRLRRGVVEDGSAGAPVGEHGRNGASVAEYRLGLPCPKRRAPSGQSEHSGPLGIAGAGEAGGTGCGPKGVPGGSNAARAAERGSTGAPEGEDRRNGAHPAERRRVGAPAREPGSSGTLAGEGGSAGTPAAELPDRPDGNALAEAAAGKDAGDGGRGPVSKRPGGLRRRRKRRAGADGVTGGAAKPARKIRREKNSRQDDHGPNSPRCVRPYQEEEEEELYILSDKEITPPPPLPPPPQNGDRDRVVHPGGWETRGDGDARGDEAELARYLGVHGVFRSIAVEIARRYLAKMSLQEAEAEALAWAIAIQASKDVQSGLADQAIATGRLVTRLRQMAGPPVWALDAAWEELEAFWSKLSDRTAEEDERVGASAWDGVESNLPY